MSNSTVTPRSRAPDCGSIRGELALMAGCTVIWAVLQLVFAGRLIYHDTWLHNFPLLFAVAKNMACTGMPDWLGRIDSGTPVSIYTTSSSLTNPVRLALVFLMSCLRPGIAEGVRFHQAHVFLLYLFFAAGMYVLGRALYARHLSAVYLFAATLFAGLCLQTEHSDQSVTILFWVPWIVVCAVKFIGRAPSATRLGI